MFPKIARYISFDYLKEKLQFDKNDMNKLIFLAVAYFFIIGSYSILKPLKVSIFLGLVGVEYQELSRLISLIIIFPCGLLYARMVDKYHRHQIFFVIIGIYSLLCVIFTIFLAHPAYGIKNTETNPYRLIGWIFEIFMDLYSAIVVSTFWGFANSISTPLFASKSYGIMTAISRIGGITTTLLALFLLDVVALPKQWGIPLLTSIAGLLLFGAIMCIYYITQKVPVKALRGYEAAYEVDYKDEDSADEMPHKKVSNKANRKGNGSKTGIFEGIRLMLVEPYVFGIFSMVYCFEVISILFDLQMNVLMSLYLKNDVSAMSSFMYYNTLSFQIVGLLLAVFGTSRLLEKIGTLKCLLIVPLCLIILSSTLLIAPSLTTIFIIVVILRGLNYGFNLPVRETLFIPTVKNIQFKAKVWIDSFGRTLSKSSGTGIRWTYASLSAASSLSVSSMLGISISVVYFGISLLVGRRYMQTIKNNEVIGKEE